MLQQHRCLEAFQLPKAKPNECLIISYLVALSTKNATNKLCIEMKGGFEGPTNDIRSLLIGFALEILRRRYRATFFAEIDLLRNFSKIGFISVCNSFVRTHNYLVCLVGQECSLCILLYIFVRY